MQIILTDFTYMNGGHFCIAGWSEEENRVIRPIRADGNGWNQDLLGGLDFEIGDVLEFSVTNGTVTGKYPHKTEDYLVSNAAPNKIRKLRNIKNNLNKLGPISESPQAIFKGNLKYKKFVKEDTECPSLGAIDILSESLEFFIDASNKLRSRFISDGVRYDNIKVSSVSLRDFWTNQGIDALNGLIGNSHKAYIRLGLARAFTDKTDGHKIDCTMMVNNVLFH